MCKARKTLINLENTEFYHCTSRCVRRAFLCGYDKASHSNFDHRRQWILDRLKLLAENFTIGICAYAIMENHWHAVLKVNQNQMVSLTENEVLTRWTNIYKKERKLVEQYIAGQASEEVTKYLQEKALIWRERLTSISWFMRTLNHNIACRANKEDGCKGHFWESRFDSQALMDDAARLASMAYVDLNPVRAGMSQTLIDSEFTSIQERIQAFSKAQEVLENDEPENEAQQKKEEKNEEVQYYQPASLMAFGPNDSENICFTLLDYLELVDWTGRIIREDKRGYIKDEVPTLVEQLELDEKRWLQWTQYFDEKFAGFAAKMNMLYLCADKLGQSHCKGVG